MRFRILAIFVFGGTFILGSLSSIWAQAWLMPYLASHPSFRQWKFVQDWATRTTLIREVREMVIRVDDAIARVGAEGESMVVGIESKRGTHSIVGSGFALTSDGFLITLASLVPQGYETKVYLNESEKPLSGEVVRRDFTQNLAIIKSDLRNMPTAEFANPELPRLGASMVMVAKSIEAGKLVTIVNHGIVRAKDQNSIRTTIFDKPALAGSPLFDLEGRIVGLNTFDSSGRLIAIPSSILRSFSGF